MQLWQNWCRGKHLSLSRRKLVLQLFQHLLKAPELRLRFGSRTLYMIHRLHRALQDRSEIGRIEPERQSQKEYCVEKKFDDAAPKGITPHLVQHLVVLFGETIHFLLHLFVHAFILPPPKW